MPRRRSPQEVLRDKQVGDRVRQLVGHNTSAAARRIGISGSTLDNYIKGARLDIFVAEKIAKHYGKPLGWFLEEQEKPGPSDISTPQLSGKPEAEPNPHEVDKIAVLLREIAALHEGLAALVERRRVTTSDRPEVTGDDHFQIPYVSPAQAGGSESAGD